MNLGRPFGAPRVRDVEAHATTSCDGSMICPPKLTNDPRASGDSVWRDAGR